LADVVVMAVVKLGLERLAAVNLLVWLLVVGGKCRSEIDR
jgi:hypothetical protein